MRGLALANVTRPRAIEESAEVAVGPQIFDVAPPRGFVLMANNYGLLTYNSSVWAPAAARALGGGAVGGGFGRWSHLRGGGSRTFGEVVEDPTGQLIYQSLRRGSPPGITTSPTCGRPFCPRKASSTSGRERLFVLRNGDLRALEPKGRFTAAGLAKDVLYVHDPAVGILAIEGGRTVPVPGGERFKGVLVTAITEGPGDSLLVGTQDQGLFQLDPRRGDAQPVGAAVAGFVASEILSVRGLADGQIAVGTLRNGLFVLDASGRLRFRMDRDSGLPDNAVLTLQTSPGSLWAGTNGGVVNPDSESGRELRRAGRVRTRRVPRRTPGIDYAASSQGVFRLTCRDRAFEAIPSLRKQAFALLSAGTLLAATADGIYEIDGASTRLVRAGLARGFSKSNDDGRIWAATQSGVVALRKASGHSIAEAPLVASGAEFEGLTDVEATSVGEDGGERLWISWSPDAWSRVYPSSGVLRSN